jgi:hypothetical protein
LLKKQGGFEGHALTQAPWRLPLTNTIRLGHFMGLAARHAFYLEQRHIPKIHQKEKINCPFQSELLLNLLKQLDLPLLIHRIAAIQSR